MNKILGLTQTKILLAILGAVVAIGGFQVWKYQQEESQKQYQKLVAEQKKACKKDLSEAVNIVKNNLRLDSVYHVELSATSKIKFKEEVKRPGINSTFESGKSYILIYQDSTALIPEDPRYEGKFFENLAKKPDKYNASPLIVVGKSLQSKKATVTTPCSPEPITVSVENLYEIIQNNDIVPIPPVGLF